MVDKMTLDFKENTIIWDAIQQQGTEICPDLNIRKDQILEAAGCKQVGIDKIVLDFENNTILWEASGQQGTEYCSDLSDRKDQILAAMDYGRIDISAEIAAVNNWANGIISEEELLKALSAED